MVYSFQREAFEKILKGYNVIISAPTGSGKTEAFVIPLLHQLLTRGPRIAYALLIYPTKALARDQVGNLKELFGEVNLTLAVFDGDTPAAERRRILERPPNVILTNFDIIHAHMMHRTAFSQLLRNVRVVVIDEVHTYTGTYGSNIHFILARLRRFAGEVQVIGASATVKNPKEFFESLIDRTSELVYMAKGRRNNLHFLMLLPTLRSNRALILDACKSMVKNGHKVLLFSNSHLGAELTAFYARRQSLKVAVHRAGLSHAFRRRVEDDFRHSLLDAVSATPTLELGIDIGLVDGAISEPVNITRLTQRFGRAGRRGQASVAVLALREDDPISQYYAKYPQHYFDDSEECFVEPSNRVVAANQILAAAMDQPISSDEFSAFQDVKNELSSTGLLMEENGMMRVNWSRASKMLTSLDIRGSGHSVAIYYGDKRIGERSLPMAMEELHPGAIYFHGGSRYVSKTLSIEGVAKAELVSPQSYLTYYTKALSEEFPRIVNMLQEKKVCNISVAYCDLSILKRVIGYVKKDLRSGSTSGAPILLEDPVEYQFYTKGMVFRAPKPINIVNNDDSAYLQALEASCYHAAEHVLIEGTNPLTGGVGTSVGGISLSSGLVFVYDAAAGGSGAAAKLYEKAEEAMRRALAILESCPCSSKDGCPRCTYSYRCGNNNNFLNKAGGIEVYQLVFAGAATSIDGYKTGDPVSARSYRR
jgi:DEAD/DEAH box helicase domain-containing protein